MMALYFVKSNHSLRSNLLMPCLVIKQAHLRFFLQLEWEVKIFLNTYSTSKYNLPKKYAISRSVKLGYDDNGFNEFKVNFNDLLNIPVVYFTTLFINLHGYSQQILTDPQRLLLPRLAVVQKHRLRLAFAFNLLKLDLVFTW